MIDLIRYNKGKFIALIISISYLIISCVFGEPFIWINVLLFLLLPLSCIFFSDEMGAYTGFAGLGRHRITKTSPGCLVAFMGWVLLTCPIWFAILSAFGLFE